MNDGAILGRGWGFPPTFANGGSEMEMVEGTDDIRQSLEILLSTSLEERNMLFEFGCDLNRFLFEEVNQELIRGIRGMVSKAILNYEPRIKMDGVKVDKDNMEEGLLIITVDYTVRATNSRYNMVYPFYVNEADQMFK